MPIRRSAGAGRRLSAIMALSALIVAWPLAVTILALNLQ